MLVVNYVWEVPLGKGRAFVNSGFLGKVFEGMQFSGITSWQTGHPFEVRGRRDSQRTGIAGWADQVGDPYAPGQNDDPSVNGGSKVLFDNPSAFQDAPFGRAGSVGRNQFYGPHFANFDLMFSKNMSITERFGAELRFECYKIFNHPNFSNPDATLGNQIGNLGALDCSRLPSGGPMQQRQPGKCRWP